MIGQQTHHSSLLSSVCAVFAVSSTKVKREQVQAVREDPLSGATRVIHDRCGWLMDWHDT
jgi:hypothetical protein